MLIKNIDTMKDLDGEHLDAAISILHLDKAKKLGIKPEIYFQDESIWGNYSRVCYYAKNKLGEPWYQHFAYLFVLNNPVLLFFLNIFGIKISSIILCLVFFIILTIAVCVILGYRMYGLLTGFLASLLMLSSLSLIIHTKAAVTQVGPSMLLMVILALCLYEYENSKKWWFLGFAGCVLGTMFLSAFIVVVFGVLNVIMVLILSRPFKIRQFLLNLILISCFALFVFWIIILSYSSYFHCNIPIMLKDACFALFGRFGESFGNKTFAEHASTALKGTFIDMYIRGDPHINKEMIGQPAVPYFFSLFFFMGVYLAFKSKRAADKILLIWVISTLLFTATVFRFGHRYILLCLPGMSILSAMAIIALGKKMSKLSKPIYKSGYALVIIFDIAFSLWFTYYNYYVVFLRSDYNLWRYHGQTEMADYIKSRFSPKDTLVVFSGERMFPNQGFHFATFGKKYDFTYWNIYFKNNSSINDITYWESNMLQTYKNILYIFPSYPYNMPFINYIVPYEPDYYPDFTNFRLAHSSITPSKIIYYSCGDPSMYIYEVKGNLN